MKIMPPENAPRAIAIGLTLAACLTGLGPAATLAVAQPFDIDTSSRESVRVFYNTVHQASEGVPMEWTGSIDNCNPGTVSPAYLDAVLLRVNYFRAMAGVPSDVTFTPENNAKAQAAALIMSANRNLSHDPPPAWSCWTQAGRDGVANSNLAYGNTGPAAISALMYDGSEVGHRRNMLDPSILTMGSGSIPSPASEANLVITMPRRAAPQVRDGFVAWPPKGFVPYQIAYPRWSLWREVLPRSML